MASAGTPSSVSVAREPSQMRRSFLVVIRGALLCALGGPTIGVLLAFVAGLLSEESPIWVTEHRGGVTFLLAGLLIWLYAAAFLGPIAGLFGAFGTWVELKLSRRGVPANTLWIFGAITGLLLGSVSPIVSALLVSTSLRSWDDITGSTLVSVWNPYTVLGALVGAILGLVVTRLVIRSERKIGRAV